MQTKMKNPGIKNLFLIVVGTLLLAFGTAVFLLPCKLICGGISGIAIILGELFGELSQTDWIHILTIGMFVLGMFTLKSKFAMKTLLSTAIYPLGISLFSQLISNRDALQFFSIPWAQSEIPSLIVSSVLGGVFVGAGCAITFLGGGSTGGVDIVALLLATRFHKLRSSVIIFVIDATIILCGIVLYADIVKSVLGILSAFIAAVMIEILYRNRGENVEK